MRTFCYFRRAAVIPFICLALPFGISNAPAGSATWNLNPTDSSWGNAANWTPATVPNGASDLAIFATSNTTSILFVFPLNIELKEMVFEAGASAYTITADDAGLSFEGGGIRNKSGVQQNILIIGEGDAILSFNDGASAGNGTVITLAGFEPFAIFNGTSTAAGATFNNEGAAQTDSFGGETFFSDTTTAGRATFNNLSDALGGITAFGDTATADHGTFNNLGAKVAGDSGGISSLTETSTAGHGIFSQFASTVAGGFGGVVNLFSSASAGQGSFHNYGAAFAGIFGEGLIHFSVGTPTGANGTFANDGGLVGGAPGGLVAFYSSSTAGDATITNHGGAAAGAGGGLITFHDDASAGNATLTNEDGAVSGAGGGTTQFLDNSIGGTARVKIFGAGQLDISSHNAPGITVGSIEGDGAVAIGSTRLTVGSNNRSVAFSGIIDDAGLGGSLTKIGSGRLALTRPNTYSGGTTIEAGELVLKNRDGFATGSGAVQVNAGTLAGKGKIAGSVTVGTGGGSGAFLAPGSASTLGTLAIQSTLTIKSDGSYNFALNNNTAESDSVVAGGATVDPGALFAATDLGNSTLSIGTVFTAINNTSAIPIAGTFSNLPDGAIISVNGNNLQADYEAGDGNDLTLTVVP
jgi:autotransporter-associated beta strand protein